MFVDYFDRSLEARKQYANKTIKSLPKYVQSIIICNGPTNSIHNFYSDG